MNPFKHFFYFLKNSFRESYDELDSFQIFGYAFYCGFGYLVFIYLHTTDIFFDDLIVLRLIGLVACISLFFKRKLSETIFRWQFFTVLFFNQGIFFICLLLNNINRPLALMDLAHSCTVIILLCNTRIFLLYFCLGIGSFIFIRGNFFPLAELPVYMNEVVIALGIMAGYCALFKIGQRRIHQEHLKTAKLLSGIMAHELRSPLSAMLFRSHRLKIDFRSQHPNDSQSINNINGLIIEINRQFQVINMLLEKLRIDNQSDIRLEKCSIIQTIKLAIENAYFWQDELHKVSYKNLTDFSFEGDLNLAMHVFLNLIKNSLYYLYGKEDGEITISSEEDSRFNKVIFHDNGPGIDQEFLYQLFKPFKTRSEGGCGLGLYFCKLVMEKIFHGTIEIISSTKPNSSFTRFILYFPKIQHDNAI